MIEFKSKPEYEEQIAATRDARMDWWRKARFGMFVHYGLFSQLGSHEWAMLMENIPIPEYEKLADEFNQVQIERIRDDTSKTRLSILYYGILGNCLMLTKQNIKLLEIFNESFQFDEQLSESYFKFE